MLAKINETDNQSEQISEPEKGCSSLTEEEVKNLLTAINDPTEKMEERLKRALPSFNQGGWREE